MRKTIPNSELVSYFTEPDNTLHKQYLALRQFFINGSTAEQVAKEFGYSIGTVYSLVRDFKDKIRNDSEDPFFKVNKVGRKPIDQQGEIEYLVIEYRKKYLSVPDIKIALDGLGFSVSEGYIYEVVHRAGFARLPRRGRDAKNETWSSITLDTGDTPLTVDPEGIPSLITAPVAKQLLLHKESFSSQLAGLLCVLPYIAHYGIHNIINESSYPQTNDINRLSSILSFVALKLSNVKRYSSDDSWCMDRGMGLFAGLNVLPKAAWYSSYSSSVTRDTNVAFLKRLQSVWRENDLLSDTVNLDFTAIPYWGEADPFENNWSGKRHKALAAIQAVIAQDPHYGILCYGDTTIRHENQNDVVLEFLDFYHADKKVNGNLKYLVFDCKFTTYENLNKLNQKSIKFITIRRRGKELVERIQKIPDSKWKKVKIQKANGKSRAVTACEETTVICGYTGKIRQIFIKDNGKIKPAIIITNEFDMSLQGLIQKYGKRWLVEKEISEQIDFFHLNRNSSGIVVKVDFDLTMTILAHNIYRLFAMDYAGYSHCDAQTIFDKFVSIQGTVDIQATDILVKLKRKRTLPLILEQMNWLDDLPIPWLLDRKIIFIADSTT
jgi:transposase